jgi:hypothetical protein
MKCACQDVPKTTNVRNSMNVVVVFVLSPRSVAQVMTVQPPSLVQQHCPHLANVSAEMSAKAPSSVAATPCVRPAIIVPSVLVPTASLAIPKTRRSVARRNCAQTTKIVPETASVQIFGVSLPSELSVPSIKIVMLEKSAQAVTVSILVRTVFLVVSMPGAPSFVTTSSASVRKASLATQKWSAFVCPTLVSLHLDVQVV